MGQLKAAYVAAIQALTAPGAPYEISPLTLDGVDYRA